MKGAVHIGPYRLGRAIASSPVSQVWAAAHGPTGRLAAVKSLTPEAARDRRELKAFRTEVRVTALLSSPNVVHCYEAGQVDELAADASGGQLAAGAPYVVMELCSGGTLDEIKRPFAWRELKQVLIALLDGLAHVHSRGVVHRTLRPAGVLLNGPEDERQGIKLAGFGLAQHVDGLLLKQQFGPLTDAMHAMAPEQVRREWRDIGPWTDLYSLGMLAWHLACNRRPFRALKDRELLSAQLEASPPPLAPTGPVPAGFDGWIERLTRKDPSRRFQRAADAAWALIRLGDVRHDLPPSAADALVVALDTEARAAPVHRSGQVDMRRLQEGLDDPPTQVGFSTEPGLTPAELTVFQGTLSPDMPPIPASWQDKREYAWQRPQGTGLGLLDLRPLPLVGRDAERAALWAQLRAVVETRSAQLVLIHGRAGIGKTRLARWMAERAHELGAATVLRATHSRAEAPGTSVRRMFATHLRLAKLSRDGVHARVKQFLFARGVRQLDEVEALTELILPSRVDGRPARGQPDALGLEAPRRVVGVEERHAVVRRFFRLLTLERPLVVWLEDAHWGNDALGLAYSLLQARRTAPMPVFFVLTARDETLAERPIERALLDEITRLDGASTLPLGPLPPAQHHTLVQRMLGLDEALAAQVVDRTGGNPLLAVEIVGDWVQRGLLEPSPGGFALAPGEALVLPDDLHVVWARRVERVLRGLPEDAVHYLEAAATLGLEVDDDEWREITDRSAGATGPADPEDEPTYPVLPRLKAKTQDIERFLRRGGLAYFPARARVRARLADRLLDFRLAEETDTGWAFAHGMIRESLLRQAAEQGRLEQHHRAAAVMLARRRAEGQRDTAERLGRHLLAAGEAEQAIEPLMAGVLERRSTLGVRPALALLSTVEQTLSALALPAADPRWGQLWITRAQLAFMRGDYDEAERMARQASLTGSAQPWERWGPVLQEALFVQAQIALRRGEVAGAEQLLHQLKASVADGRNPRLHALAMFGLASVARQRNQAEAALVYLGDARRSFEEAEDAIGVADCWKEMAYVDLTHDELKAAAELFKRAIEVYEAAGDRHKLALCLNGLAEVARHRGDLGEAESGYRHALQIFESVGSAQATVARLNLALVHLKRGAWEAAAQDGGRARQLVEAEGRRGMLGSAELVLLAAAAGQRHWEAFDEHLGAASGSVRAGPLRDPDAAWCAHKAGDLAMHAGQTPRARAAWRLAWAQYRGLDDTAAMARLEVLIGPPEEDS